MRVVSWNLFHGRADPAAGRPLLHEFATTLAGWSWDVALLQEVPPWWPPLLGRACGADHRTARTSRNALLPLRRAIASRWPDLMKSNGGGCNAILVRPPLTVTAHESRRLRWRPERRVVHAVRVTSAGGSTAGGRTGESSGPTFESAAWVGNVHGQKGAWDDGPGLADPLADLAASVDRLEAWARGGEGAVASGRGAGARPAPPTADAGPQAVPLALGGDLNLPRDAVERALPAGWARLASSGPDHVVGRGTVGVGDSWRPARGSLSDHAALAIDVAIAGTLPA